MRRFDGKLLMGGWILRHVQGELDEESPASDSEEWLLTGRLTIGPDDGRQLQLDRMYRLELDDGRAGQVVVSQIEAADETQVFAQFHPTVGGSH